jgi:hypothetical protein
MIRKRNKSFFTKAKKGVKFVEEIYTKYEKIYNFYCPKCRTKFDTDTYKYTITVYSTLNLITRHSCGTRCHRFIKTDYDIVEKLFLESNKTPTYYPKHKKIREGFKKRMYIKQSNHKINDKDEFEV